MYSFLTVDLNSVTSKQRDDMYAELAKLKYSKLPAVTTLFSKSWEDGHQLTAYVNSVKGEVATAATNARITNYDATVIISPNAQVAWKV